MVKPNYNIDRIAWTLMFWAIVILLPVAGVLLAGCWVLGARP
jgi:hypothetical protein